MIRRLKLAVPAVRSGLTHPIRILAISDERSPSLEHPHNRDALGPLDVIVAAGDLEPDYLSFLGDAFRVPMLFVRGNHDRGGAWQAGVLHLPQALDDRFECVAGLDFAGLSWPGKGDGRAQRDGGSAWWQALNTVRRAVVKGTRPHVVVSHVPPRGLGDVNADEYHRGFSGYRWLAGRLRPRLWLHGHTTIASARDWRTTWGPTTLVNVTGGVLIELIPSDWGSGDNIGAR